MREDACFTFHVSRFTFHVSRITHHASPPLATPMLLMPSLTGALLELTQAAAQRLDFLLVGILLTFSQLEHFQHVFHIIHGLAEGPDDAINFVNGLLNGRGRRGAAFPGGRRDERARLLPGGSRFRGRRSWRNGGLGGVDRLAGRFRFHLSKPCFSRLRFSRFKSGRFGGRQFGLRRGILRPRCFRLARLRRGGFRQRLFRAGLALQRPRLLPPAATASTAASGTAAAPGGQRRFGCR
jgi:hypothetical protein